MKPSRPSKSISRPGALSTRLTTKYVYILKPINSQTEKKNLFKKKELQEHSILLFLYAVGSIDPESQSESQVSDDEVHNKNS